MRMDTSVGNDSVLIKMEKENQENAQCPEGKDDVEGSYVFVNDDSDETHVGDLEIDGQSDSTERDLGSSPISAEEGEIILLEERDLVSSEVQDEIVQNEGRELSVEIPSSNSEDQVSTESSNSITQILENGNQEDEDKKTEESADLSPETDNAEEPSPDNYLQESNAAADNSSDSFSLEIGGFAISCNNVDSRSESAISEKKQAELGVEEKVVSDSVESSRTEPANGSGENVSELRKEQKIYIVRVPRFSENSLRTQIEKAQREVDKKTMNRDTIRIQMQNQKVVCMEHRKKVEDARKVERESRDAVVRKRQEIDSVQSMLDILKNFRQIIDMNEKIEELHRRISHETNTLKEEKLLMREINQLKQNRDHLSSNLHSDEELQEAFENQEQMQTHVQKLKEELDFLRKKVQLAEGEMKSVKNGSDREHEILRDLQAEYKKADNLRQEAYMALRDLKRETYAKNRHFYSYKDDLKAVANFNATNDRDSLRVYCSQQVEKIMEMWNNDDDFRKRYMEVNAQSVVRRFKTWDGRSLGPDEEPAVIPTAIDQKETVDSAASFPLTKSSTNPLTKTEEEKTESSVKPTLTKSSTKALTKTKEEKTESSINLALTKMEVKPSVDEVKEKKRAEEQLEQKKTKELARREAEMKRENEAIEERERFRLEQIAKAKEAEDRKRKKAEKAQAKAEIKAQKEAENREKKKKARQEQKKRKKEKSKANPINSNIEDRQEKEAEQEEPESSTQDEKKKKNKPIKPMKEPKSLPTPLRNKGKRKLQSWFWPILAAIIIFSIFFIIIIHQR